MAERRQLTFQDLDDVLPEVERLLQGHALAGQWSLAQICHHLSTSIRITARPTTDPGPPTAQQAAIRAGFFALGRFPEGRPSPPPFVPPEGLDVVAESQALAESIRRFAKATGPFPAHPVIGPLTGEEWRQFHVMHAAHHLGFVVPT